MVVTLFQRLTVYLVFMLCTQVSKHTFPIYTQGCSSELAFFFCRYTCYFRQSSLEIAETAFRDVPYETHLQNESLVFSTFYQVSEQNANLTTANVEPSSRE